MTKVFNSEFETSLKIMLMLFAVHPQPLTADRIVCYDFISTYGSEFGVYTVNLNGENSYRFEELGARRIRAMQALKSLVLDGLTDIRKTTEGFQYVSNVSGNSIAQSLTSEYAKQYIEAVKGTHKAFQTITDIELVTEINRKSVRLIRGD